MPLAPDEMQTLFTDALGEHVEESQIQWDQLTVTLDAEGYVEAARLARDDERLACDLFDCISGVDERDDGFSIVTILYSTEHHHRVLLKHLCDGGRENPVAPSLTDLYRGADWHEREAWDMFGIEFDGHPGLAPRILTTENFEGWPLRKDFYLATREAKPWPGIKEPQELDEEGNVIERELTAEPGAAPGPMELDEAMAEQAKRAAGLLDQETVEVEAAEQADEEQEPSQPSEREDAGGPPATPPPDGTDASAGTPEEAPVEGGLRESADEAADAGPGPSGGERPGTDEATDVDEEDEA